MQNMKIEILLSAYYSKDYVRQYHKDWIKIRMSRKTDDIASYCAIRDMGLHCEARRMLMEFFTSLN